MSVACWGKEGAGLREVLGVLRDMTSAGRFESVWFRGGRSEGR